MADSKIQVIGICRWSYPSDSKSFRMTSQDLVQAREKLYAPERMEHRLFLLEHIVLPSLKQQTDQDFTLVMLMGENIPKPYRMRVLELIRDIPQIHPVFAEEGQNQLTVCNESINALRRGGITATAQFRLDDDDAVAVTFVEQARGIFEMIRPMYERGGLFGLDFAGASSCAHLKRPAALIRSPYGSGRRAWWYLLHRTRTSACLIFTI